MPKLKNKNKNIFKTPGKIMVLKEKFFFSTIKK